MIVGDDLHLFQISSISFKSALLWKCIYVLDEIIFVIVVTLISCCQYQTLYFSGIVLFHCLMYWSDIRKKFGTEKLVMVWNFMYIALVTGGIFLEPTKFKAKLLSFGTSLSYACVLWILLLISFIRPSLLGTIWTEEIHLFRYACLITSILFIAIISTAGSIMNDTIRFNMFRFACISDDMKALQRMINNSQNVNFNDLDYFKRNGFSLACEYNQCQVVKFLLENSGQIDLNFNQQNALGQSGFHVAAMNRNRDILELILYHSTKAGIDLNHKDNEGKTGYDLGGDLFQLTEAGMELKPRPLMVNLK